MATLHTINKSPFERDALASCLRFATNDSAVLLIEDGIYAAMAGTAKSPLLEQAGIRLKLYALGPDLEARGIAPERLIAGIDIVDYGGFVDLVAEYDRTQAWL